MNAIIALCGIAAAGWVTPYTPTDSDPSGAQNASQQAAAPPNYLRQSNPQFTPARSAGRVNGQAAENHGQTQLAERSTNNAQRRPRMPFPPTDPRALSGENFPLPPTMNENGFLPGAAAGPHSNAAGLAQSHSAPQKPFSHYSPPPGTSPYMMLNASTADGTVNTYTAYVRPALDQQRENQAADRAWSRMDDDDTPPAYYPPAFMNLGSYYPSYTYTR
jgi:hypothetical protein